MVAAKSILGQHCPVVYILWDASHIWGLMAWRAVNSLGIPCRLIKAKDIADGVCLGKSDRVPLLLAPGGSARRKAIALGEKGRNAVRSFVRRGGNYLGFCGGAGLALSYAQQEQGLQICPLYRASYQQRLHHLISGHVWAYIRPAEAFSPPPLLMKKAQKNRHKGCLSLPVWWPGRFEIKNVDSADVAILAECAAPGKDFCIADIPFRSIPQRILAFSQEIYGVNLAADFLTGQPLIVSGKYGLGRYILSYSHLETPHSLQANAWLAAILYELTAVRPGRDIVSKWDLQRSRAGWLANKETLPLLSAQRRSHALLRLAVQNRLFFTRTPWLAGWRAGLPGAALNSLHAILSTAVSITPSEAALEYWHSVRGRFSQIAELFFSAAEGWLHVFRLAQTLTPSLPGVVDKRSLDEQQKSLFGRPMQGGGLLEEIIAMAEELVYLSQSQYKNHD